MNKIPHKIVYLTIFLFIAAGLFYWFQLRPSQIKSFCSKQALEKAKSLLKTKAGIDPLNFELKAAANRDLYIKEDYTSSYQTCLNQQGL